MSSRTKIFLKSYLFIRNAKERFERESRYSIFQLVTILLLSEKKRTIRQLSNLLHVSHPSMSDTISQLESNGLISKKPAEDKRYKVIQLTKEGDELLKKICEKRDDYNDEMFSRMSEVEIEKLKKLLAKLNFFGSNI